MQYRRIISGKVAGNLTEFEIPFYAPLRFPCINSTFFLIVVQVFLLNHYIGVTKNATVPKIDIFADKYDLGDDSRYLVEGLINQADCESIIRLAEVKLQFFIKENIIMKFFTTVKFFLSNFKYI